MFLATGFAPLSAKDLRALQIVIERLAKELGIVLGVPSIIRELIDKVQPMRRDRSQRVRMSKHSFTTEKRIFNGKQWVAIAGPCDDLPRKGSHRVRKPGVVINWYNRLDGDESYRLMFRLGMKVGPKTTIISERRFGN